MLDPKLKNNQFISDIIKDFSIDGTDLNIIQTLEPFNGVCLVLVIDDDAILQCNKNIQLCNLTKLLLQSVFFLDYATLINTGTATTSLNFKCPVFNIDYNVSVTIDRALVDNILTLDITYNFYDGPMTNDPYFTIISKLVGRTDILENSIKQDASGFIVPQYIIPSKVSSISYASEDHSAFEIDINKCNFRLIRSVDKFIDNKICLEIPASISVSFNNVQLNNCAIDSQIVSAFNKFFSQAHLVKTSDYTVDSDGIQNSLNAEYSTVIDLFLFNITLTYSSGEVVFSVNMIEDNDIIFTISFTEQLDDLYDIFNGLTLTSPTITGSSALVECESIDTNTIDVDMFLPGYIQPASQFAKFDYVFIDTSTGDLFIVKNVTLQGQNSIYHKRPDGGLNHIEDYVNFSGDLQVSCAIPLDISYEYWGEMQYGKFTDTSILSINSTLQTNPVSGFTNFPMPVYDLDIDNINIQPDCDF
jgi:hypothetical protein